jgi:hypothetical protein
MDFGWYKNKHVLYMAKSLHYFHFKIYGGADVDKMSHLIQFRILKMFRLEREPTL